MTGRCFLNVSLVVIGFGAATGCGEGRAETVWLKDDAAAACDSRQPLLLRVSPAGQYAVNGEVMDSAQIVRWLRTVMPPRVNKVVMVHADAHENAMRWIVPAIEASGGVAYKPDQACVLGAPPPWWLP